jgi:hypothetical protein
MAFASRSEMRLKAATNYDGAKATLTNESYRRTGDMGSKADKLYGTLESGSAGKKLYGGYLKADGYTGVAGNMTSSGYTSGPKWKRAMEPGELKPGNRSQASNTTRMTPGKGDKEPVMKVTSKTPKELRGGRGR